MKKLFPFALLALLSACNNSKKEKESVSGDTTNVSVSSPDISTTPIPPAGSATVTYSVSDTVRTPVGSILVQKDKDKLSPGNDYLAMVTANGANGESFVLNFLFTTKPGMYPVVGLSLVKGNEVYGGILGGKPKMTSYKVNLAECTDMGSNNMGGHKWKLSGSVDEEVTIDAMGIMKMDAKHPDAVKVNKISFTNLTFDDNWEQLLEEGMKKLQQNK